MAFALRVLLLLCGISGLFTGVWSVATVPIPCCPTGWTRFMDRCFVFQNTRLNFTDAVEACNNMNGSFLAPVRNSVEDALLFQLIRNGNGGAVRDTWIGFHDAIKEGTFVSIDGEKSKFQNFRTGQPDNFLDGEDCAEIDDEGNWNDDGCADQNTYLCAKDLW
ncbi:galactose-specific lectin nattectin-like [Corythoichthys intestinalis]|uniref:galactose-specific lectin nattectin-like n=1 Tax=Corythoichthys intestinalis TaxID=161448 RepID=UPI0025A5DCCD|nr:galactose-specific lectin nattectin-like [Corythoichthys intestinalis]XP_057686126.1 galactose-specific lectin nattectin-like [Corythoichthys intestinalis]